MGMSSYPYASNYISGAIMGTTEGSLPAYPVTYACNEYLPQTFDSTSDQIEALGKFNAVFWNSDGENNCLDTDGMWDTYSSYIWDYLYCRSLLMPSGSKSGSNDMLYASEWNVEDTISWCNEQYDIAVDIKGPASRKYGGRNVYKAMSNIVFSNGDMDPWMPGGVLTEQSESVVNIMIEAAGHHLDLMFSNSNDPQSVIDARAIEVEQIEKWIAQSNAKWNAGMCDGMNEDIGDSLFVANGSVVENSLDVNYNVLIGLLVLAAVVMMAYAFKQYSARKEKIVNVSEIEPLRATIY